MPITSREIELWRDSKRKRLPFSRQPLLYFRTGSAVIYTQIPVQPLAEAFGVGLGASFSEATPKIGGLCETNSCFRFRTIRHLYTSFFFNSTLQGIFWQVPYASVSQATKFFLDLSSSNKEISEKRNQKFQDY